MKTIAIDNWETIERRMLAGERLRWVPASIHQIKGNPGRVLMLGNDALDTPTEFDVCARYKGRLIFHEERETGVGFYELNQTSQAPTYEKPPAATGKGGGK